LPGGAPVTPSCSLQLAGRPAASQRAKRAAQPTWRAEQALAQGAPAELARTACARRSRQLARDEGDAALAALAGLPETPARRSLEQLVEYVLERIH
jgi:geranylgeranyl pyrophosphate synthase